MINGNKQGNTAYKIKIQQYNGGKYASRVLVHANKEEKILIEFNSDCLPAIALYNLSGQIASIETTIDRPDNTPEKINKPITIPRI